MENSCIPQAPVRCPRGARWKHAPARAGTHVGCRNLRHAQRAVLDQQAKSSSRIPKAGSSGRLTRLPSSSDKPVCRVCSAGRATRRQQFSSCWLEKIFLLFTAWASNRPHQRGGGVRASVIARPCASGSLMPSRAAAVGATSRLGICSMVWPRRTPAPEAMKMASSSGSEFG